MVAREVFEVLYSPVKAFKKIIEKPEFKGVLLILVLFMLSTVLTRYAFFSRIFFETGTNGYVSFLTKDIVNCRQGLLDYLIASPIIFFLGWVIYFGALWIAIKLFGHETDSLKRLLIVVGHLLIITVVFLLAIAALYSTLPKLKLPQDAWNYWNPQATQEEANSTYVELIEPKMQETWAPTVTYQLLVVVSYLHHPFNVWTVALSIIAVRSLYKITWKRATAISVTAYIIYILLRLFI